MRTMSRLSIFLGLVLLLFMLPVGVATAQQPAAEGSGTAVISDSSPTTMSDRITITMSGVSAPPSGSSYQAWLVSDSGSQRLDLGTLSVEANGAVNHTYTSPNGENLIAKYNKLTINQGNTTVFSADIPAGAMAHIRHLLVAWPETSNKGILTNLREQLQLALDHANLAKNATVLEGENSVRLHVHHVINIIEGASGPNFDQASGNPGDGIGVLTHAADRKHAGFAAGQAPNRATLVDQSKNVEIAGKNAEDWAVQARDQAVVVLSQSNINNAKLLLNPIISQLEAAINGFDANRNGQIEYVAGEAGARQAYVAAQRMATYNIQAGTGAGPSPFPPVVGETTIPLLAQIALAASLVLIGTGGVFLLRGRRSRANS